MDTRISGKTRLLGVFGTPIKHSGSPIMYNFCFDYYGIDCAYLDFDTDASQVKASLDAMRRLNMMADGVPCKMEYHPLSETELMHDTIRKTDILINGTSVGMRPMAEGQSLVTDLTVFNENLVVYDVIYNPLVTKLIQIPTSLLARWTPQSEERLRWIFRKAKIL